MRRRGMGEAEILAALQVANEQRCQPPLEAREVEKIAASVARYEPGGGDAAGIPLNGHGATQPPRFNLTDLGNAARLVHHHGRNLRYCWLWRKWLVWDGQRWVKDDTGEVYRLAKDTVASIYQEAAAAPDDEARKALAKHAVRSEAGARVKEMVDLARSDVPVMPDELDASPDLLNTESGTIDLRTGELREHRREDLITKLAPVEYRPDATAPDVGGLPRAGAAGRGAPCVRSARRRLQRHRRYLRAMHVHKPRGRRQRQVHVSGGPLRGAGRLRDASAYGDAPRQALGRRAQRRRQAQRRSVRLGLRDGGGPPPGGVENKRPHRPGHHNRPVHEGGVVRLRPTHKLWLSTNHKPEIRGTDAAIWRRIRLVPWAVTIPPAEQDKKLPEKLRSELPGILAWIVRGCLQWRRKGLQAPDEVRKATGEYRVEMDVLAGFLAECCEFGTDHWDYAKDLYESYKRWCDENGERPEPQRKFGGRLGERSFQRDRGGSRGAGIWRGVRLTEEEKAWVEGMLTLRKSRISSTSDPADPEIGVGARKS